ncbi:3-oxoacyl-ACP reductase FabG [Tumebacillus sp. ITR2]|uniref:3-oxoacyl-ACP reductase FabG n=1 Tax=Tumebacillus amylolyticus TaxID=2801339 RepID=A0ABS1JA09_9BACL|nr:3-oxoacyl-ACP reductase FabG [Tumebacillus amylolyticus]
MQGKTAIVTGGGRGIGASTAKELAAQGANVIVNYVGNAAAAAEVVEEIKKAGGHAHAVQANVTVEADVQKLIDETLTHFGRLDILVSNANMNFVRKPLEDMTWDEFSDKLNNELKAAFLLTKAVLPVMKEQRSGRLIYITSGQGKNVTPGFIAHGTAKSGLNSFVRYVAKEVGPYGITANNVAPGLIETDATSFYTDEARQAIAANIPLGRLGQPDDLSKVIAFLASDDSKYMTGSYTSVNGGSLMDL